MAVRIGNQKTHRHDFEKGLILGQAEFGKICAHMKEQLKLPFFHGARGQQRPIAAPVGIGHHGRDQMCVISGEREQFHAHSGGGTAMGRVEHMGGQFASQFPLHRQSFRH